MVCLCRSGFGGRQRSPASASITAVSCICLCAQYSEIEGEAPNLSNHSSIILRAFPTPQRGAESSLLMELVLCVQDQSRIMNSSLNNSYWGKLICFGVWQMRRVFSPASLFSPNDWCMSWNINAGHGFQSHLLWIQLYFCHSWKYSDYMRSSLFAKMGLKTTFFNDENVEKNMKLI